MFYISDASYQNQLSLVSLKQPACCGGDAKDGSDLHWSILLKDINASNSPYFAWEPYVTQGERFSRITVQNIRLMTMTTIVSLQV